MYRECVQKLQARAVDEQALGIEGLGGESMGRAASLKMLAVSNTDVDVGANSDGSAMRLPVG